MKAIIIAIVMMVGPSGPTMGPPTPNTLGGLRAGQQLHVQFTTDGCEHSLRYDFQISRSPKGVKVVIWRQGGFRWAKKGQGRRLLGQFALNRRHVEQLDALFAWYRKYARAGRCTTSDAIVLSWKAGKRVLRSERIVDGTCQSDKAPNAITLMKLVQVLSGKSPW